MLTEGWDANTVTHVLGIRAFGTQLLCEQVVGRALRRASYDADEKGMFEPEYAEVYGVPFSFLCVAGKGRVKVAKPVRTVRALARASEPPDRVPARHRLSLRDADRAPRGRLRRVIDPRVVDAGGRHQDRARPDRRRSARSTRSTSRDQRMQTVAFAVAKRTLDNHFRDEDGERAAVAVAPARRASRGAGSTNAWSPYLKDGTFPQMLLFAEYSHAAADRIHRAIVGRHQGREAPRPGPATV